VIQRWIAGGNSSGVLSTHSDPFLGVPQSGERRFFEYLDEAGEVQRVDLEDQPLTELQWGMYLFVPSVSALKGLPGIVTEPEPGKVEAEPRKAPNSEEFNAWQRVIEDPKERDKAWQQVLGSENGTTKNDYGRLIGGADQVLKVLKDGGKTYSVCGYGRRLQETVGRGYLGEDEPEHGRQAESRSRQGVNQAIADISEEQAFTLAAHTTNAVLARWPTAGLPGPGGSVEKAVDIVALSEWVLASLCTQWFGLPDRDEKFMVNRNSPDTGKARCPGHFLSVSRYVFWPYPSDAETAEAKLHGKAVLASVQGLLAAASSNDPQAPKLGSLAQSIKELMADDSSHPDIVARTIAGVMLGFPPTVHLNFLSVMRAWIENHATNPSLERKISLWDLQEELVASKVDPDDHKALSALLRGPLLAQMRKSPVPELVWREAAGSMPGPGDNEPDKIGLGLVAALKDEHTDDRMMFGGARPPAGTTDALETVHACPGYDMAIGVLLGMTTALMLAGTIRPTASPTIVTLVTGLSEPAQ
jgi:hypothetical protein